LNNTVLEQIANEHVVELHHSVLTLATNIVPKFQNITVNPDVAALLPQFQKELDLVKEYLIQGKDVDVSFTPHLTKKQKKKISILNSNNMCSKVEPKGD